MACKAHDGTIIPDEVNVMWGTDLTTTQTVEDGQVGMFFAIDQANAECAGIHAVKPATRFEALEPIHQGVREYVGGVG